MTARCEVVALKELPANFNHLVHWLGRGRNSRPTSLRACLENVPAWVGTRGPRVRGDARRSNLTGFLPAAFGERTPRRGAPTIFKTRSKGAPESESRGLK